MKYVKCWVNDIYEEVPLMEYLDFCAWQYGFSDFRELREAGLQIEVSKKDIVEKPNKEWDCYDFENDYDCEVV